MSGGAASLACPHYGSLNVQTGAKHPGQTHRCREKECRRFFSVTVGTAIQPTKLELRVWALALYLMTTEFKGRASMRQHRDLGISQKAAWHPAHRLREAWDTTRVNPLTGPVEVDETYIGALDPNEHESQKPNAGWGLLEKAAVDTENAANAYTHEHRVYEGLSHHKTVKYSVEQYMNGKAHTNGVESSWSILKQAHRRTFHQLSAKHLQRCVIAFCGRYSIYDLHTIDHMRTVAKGMEGERFRFRELIP